ncbi:MAG: hypothetical protein A2527_08940 [Candidatus Lambdaproteobacteria bacterium RIFOXYD2_FULL_50_16]|uniref:Isoprenylcysteine carboxylmethyltransferase family protein n=1 Tax=Candidatus Lambdaproteobacteria bacterium RIFOXYD2_FULL_50_16 TaxID=1817772 RepID=A0A1F6GAZ1_9PROT|nr:MAG: hypothetical protein A2527_08940 [Candidatus Lambdaproteobacteria bacterium RIFOXYD2_FULL_50_16]
MRGYERLFGAGPKGALISLVGTALTFYFQAQLQLGQIHGSPTLGLAFLMIGVLGCVSLILWSVKALPVEKRGRELTILGPFKWLRHPLYAGFIGPFGLGLALWADDWSFLIFLTALHPVWHLIIQSEERLMLQEFGEDYRQYCAQTGRFIPRLFSPNPPPTKP